MLDLSKPLQTRDGRKARIICVDRKSDIGHNLLALILDEETTEYPQCYNMQGKFIKGEDHKLDLMNIGDE